MRQKAAAARAKQLEEKSRLDTERLSREALDALLAKEMQAQIEREDQQAANYQQMVQDSRVIENEARAKRVPVQQQ